MLALTCACARPCVGSLESELVQRFGMRNVRSKSVYSSCVTMAKSTDLSLHTCKMGVTLLYFIRLFYDTIKGMNITNYKSPS